MLGQAGPKLDPSWSQVGPKLAHVGPSWSKLAQVSPKLAPSWPQVGPKLAHVGPSWPNMGQTGPKLVPSWPQVGPKLAHVGSSWSKLVSPLASLCSPCQGVHEGSASKDCLSTLLVVLFAPPHEATKALPLRIAFRPIWLFHSGASFWFVHLAVSFKTKIS